MSTASIAAAATIVASPSIAMAHTVPAIVDTGDGAARLAAERLARAEQMIEALRTRYICRDWKFDDDAGERLLRFFRSAVRFPESHEAQPGYEDEWTFVIRFVGDHGQSLDWLTSGDVCGLICGAASRSSAAAIPSASTTQVDAELIRLGAQFDRLRDVHTALNAEALQLTAPMRERLYAVRHDRAAFETVWEDEKKKGTTPELREVTARLDELWTSLDSLLDIIMKARPVSFSGVAVKLRALCWFLDIDDEDLETDQDRDHQWLNIINRDVRYLAVTEPSPEASIESESKYDPVFAAIDAEKLAWSNFVGYLRQPYKARSRSREGELSDLHDDAADDLYRTPPRTRAGHTALINHVIRMIELDCGNGIDEDPFHLTGGQLIMLLRGLQISNAIE